MTENLQLLVQIYNEKHETSHSTISEIHRETRSLDVVAERLGVARSSIHRWIAMEADLNGPPENKRFAKKFGSVLRRIRNQLGLSVRDVKKQTGLTNSYLSQIETGIILNPSFFTMIKLLRLYGISVDEFLERAASR